MLMNHARAADLKAFTKILDYRSKRGWKGSQINIQQDALLPRMAEYAVLTIRMFSKHVVFQFCQFQLDDPHSDEAPCPKSQSKPESGRFASALSPCLELEDPSVVKHGEGTGGALCERLRWCRF